jgi:hypothetical protein
VSFDTHLRPSLAASEPVVASEGVLVRVSALEGLLVRNEGIVVK